MASSDKSEKSNDVDAAPTKEKDVPLKPDDLTFSERQKQRLVEMERRVEEEVKRKKKDWEKEVERMAEEFLCLYPADKSWGSDELLNDPFVVRRRGSTDVLDNKRMKTMYLEYPDKGRRYKIRFDMKSYKRDSVRVIREIDRYIVRAIKEEDGEDGKVTEREYVRKLAKPHDVDLTKMKSHLTRDGILIIEAPLPPHSLNLAKLTGSPSHSSTYSTISSRSRSPSSSPHTPVAMPKIGIPTFAGQNGERRMTLFVEIGNAFKPKEITVQVIKENRILVKAKHEERTSERFLKSKYCKEFELPEKIETYSLRAGLMEDGKLLIGALGKTDNKNSEKKEKTEDLAGEILAQTTPCNVLNLSTFPPAAAPIPT